MIPLFTFLLQTYILTILLAAFIGFLCSVMLSEKLDQIEIQVLTTKHTRVLYPVLNLITALGQLEIFYANLEEVQYLKLLFFGTSGVMVFRSLLTFLLHQLQIRIAPKNP